MEKQNFSVTLIDKNIEKSLLYQFKANFSKIIETEIRTVKKGDNFTIQNVDWLCYDENGIPGMADVLLKKYNSVFSSEYSKVIPTSIKVNQAALMDSLMFGVNMNTGDIKLYTMNIETLFGLGIDADKLHSRCYERNLSGILHAYRIDVEYVSQREFQFKAVALNKNNYLHYEDFVFFPYIYVKSAMELLQGWLNKGFVLHMEQEVGGIIKGRYITCLEKVLKYYCDNEVAVNNIRPSYFPMKGYMYAPVVGAPSITAMVSKIDLFSLNKISPVRSMAEIKVEKVKNPITEVVTRTVITNRLIMMEKDDSWGYLDIMYSLPRGEELFKDYESRGLVNTSLLSKYLNSLKEEEIQDICDMIPGVYEEVNAMSKLFSRNELVDISKLTNDGLRKMLKEGIFSVISVNKDCSYSSHIVTNNRDVLKGIYGENYFAECESKNVRIGELQYLVSRGADIRESLKYCGFPLEDELIAAAESYRQEAGKNSIDENIAKNLLRGEALDSIGAEDRRESSTGSILVRKCFGRKKEDGTVEDYYRYVALPKVVRIVRLG